jgi:hypothetical protein
MPEVARATGVGHAKSIDLRAGERGTTQAQGIGLVERHVHRPEGDRGGNVTPARSLLATVVSIDRAGKVL